MTRRPRLAAEDDLTAPATIDLNAALAPLLDQRYRSPIVRPSKAADIEALIDTSLPGGGDTLETLADQIARATEAYPRRNTHPGFFGWIAPSGLPSDPLAHAMVAALNENVGGYWASPVGTTIERSVIRWLAELTGLDTSAEGVFLSGGSIANMSGIACALCKCFGADYKRRGISAYAVRAKPVVICSEAAHFSVRRAAAMLGIGTDQVIALPTDDRFRLRSDKLAQAIDEYDNIVCVVATAGTTNTGAIDPLGAIADLCQAHGIWLHVDAALGGGGLLAASLRPRYRGIERADSIVMDLHKWFFQSLDGSLLLYRDAEYARQMFFDSPEYLRSSATTAAEDYMFFHIAPELSRRFRGLPYYFALRCYGLDRLGRNVLHNVECAEYLASMIEAERDLELVVAPQLSILCFRFCPPHLAEVDIDRLNEDIRQRIQLEGDFLMSPTRVNDRPVLRVCIINHATRAEHVEGLLAAVKRIGNALTENE